MTVRVEADVATNMLFTTHSLPISFLLKELKSCCGSVVFLGIQPAQLEFMSPLTPAVHEAVEKTYGMLKVGSNFTRERFVKKWGMVPQNGWRLVWKRKTPSRSMRNASQR